MEGDARITAESLEEETEDNSRLAVAIEHEQQAAHKAGPPGPDQWYFSAIIVRDSRKDEESDEWPEVDHGLHGRDVPLAVAHERGRQIIYDWVDILLEEGEPLLAGQAADVDPALLGAWDAGTGQLAPQEVKVLAQQNEPRDHPLEPEQQEWQQLVRVRRADFLQQPVDRRRPALHRGAALEHLILIHRYFYRQPCGTWLYFLYIVSSWSSYFSVDIEFSI